MPMVRPLRMPVLSRLGATAVLLPLLAAVPYPAAHAETTEVYHDGRLVPANVK